MGIEASELLKLDSYCRNFRIGDINIFIHSNSEK